MLRKILSVPRPFGSLSLRKFFEWLSSAVGDCLVQEFVTSDGRTGRNLIFRYGKIPKWILGTHIDTYPSSCGFNDGFSGVLTILSLVPVLTEKGVPFHAVFFDNEEAVSTKGWDGLTDMGSYRFVKSSFFVPPTDGVLVFDMVFTDGCPPFPTERFSETYNPSLISRFNSLFSPRKVVILDDHVPFLLEGVPSVLFIGWDDPNWHTDKDNPTGYTNIRERLAKLVSSLSPLL